MTIAAPTKELVVTSIHLGTLCTRRTDGLCRIVGVRLEVSGEATPVVAWLDPDAGVTRLVFLPWLGWCVTGGSATRYTDTDIDAPHLVDLDGEPLMRLLTSEGLMRLVIGRIYEIRPDEFWGWSLCATS